MQVYNNKVQKAQESARVQEEHVDNYSSDDSDSIINTNQEKMKPMLKQDFQQKIFETTQIVPQTEQQEMFHNLSGPVVTDNLFQKRPRRFSEDLYGQVPNAQKETKIDVGCIEQNLNTSQ